MPPLLPPPWMHARRLHHRPLRAKPNPYVNDASGAPMARLPVLFAASWLSLPALASAHAAPDSFAPLVRKVEPTVVNISVTEDIPPDAAQVPARLRGTPFEKQFRQRRGHEQMEGAGSGFIIDPAGIIVTNDHVVGHATRILVSLADGTELPAHLIGVDELTDIAVIKVDTPEKLPAATWGNSDQVQVGDWILACGNPFGLGASVSAGIISARGRDIGAGPFDDFLQLDAPINPGNSGGPSFNLDGQVVGLNTAIVSPTGGSVGVGFAIPSTLARTIVDALVAKGHIDRGWLGVTVQDGSGPPQHATVAVASVDKGGPASAAGIHGGDQVLAIDGKPVENARTLIRSVAAAPPGSALRLSLHRRDRDLDVSVTVGKRPADDQS
jgi:serine protease Do